MHYRGLMCAQAEAQRPQGSAYRSAKSSSAFGSGIFSDGAVTRVKRLDNKTKTYINGMLRRAEHRAWCLKHGKTLPPPRLHPVILRVIREWFDLVDDDGSGTLEHHELLGALQAARIPCDSSSISEMIKLMDANRDGCIGWGEFEAFMMDEFAAGKHLLSGEYVLPSGMALPFGVMIRQLKRTQMMQEITQGGETRRKWLHYNVDLSADARAVAEQEEAIRSRKAYNETLHNREVIQVQAEQPADADSSDQQQQQQLLPCDDPSASVGPLSSQRAASAGAAAQRRSATGRPYISADDRGTAAAVMELPGVGIVAGVPVMSAEMMAPMIGVSAQQQQQRRTSAASMLADMHATAAAAAQTAATTNAATAVLGRAGSACISPIGHVLPVVPRLQLSCVMQHAGGSHGSMTATNMLTNPGQHERASTKSSGRLCNVVIEPGSVLASARTSYWLVDATAGKMRQPVAGAAGGSSSVAEHLYQQLQQPLAGSSNPNCCCCNSRGPSVGGGKRSPADTTGSTTPGRAKSPRSPCHTLAPQPCRNEWGVLTASSIAQQHSVKCKQPERRGTGHELANDSLPGTFATCCEPNNSMAQTVIAAAAVVASASSLPQQQVRHHPLCAPKDPAPLTARTPATSARSQAIQAAKQAQQSGYLDVCIKHLLSARVSPPGALLSPDYVGPMEAAVAAVHTPRQAAVAAAASHTARSASSGACSQRARTADACGSCKHPTSLAPASASTQLQPPRSARAVVATYAGGAITVDGRLVQYLPSPRQGLGSQSGRSKSARDPERLLGCAPCLWDASEQWQLGCGVPQPGRFSSPECTAVAVVCSSCSSSSAKLLHSPRHSSIAQKLVKVHSSYARASLAPQHSSGIQQDDTTLQHINMIDGSSTGSSLSSSRRSRDEQQQRTVTLTGAPLSVDFSSASTLMMPESNQQLPYKQRKGKESLSKLGGQVWHDQQGSKLPCARRSSDSLSGDGAAAAAATSSCGKRPAASGPLGGHHPAYTNSYVPSTGGRCCSRAGSQAGGAAGMVHSHSGDADSLLGCGLGFSACGSAATAHSSPRLSYSGLSPRGRRG